MVGVSGTGGVFSRKAMAVPIRAKKRNHSSGPTLDFNAQLGQIVGVRCLDLRAIANRIEYEFA